MILILNICQEKLHYFEFVRPIERILGEKQIPFYTKHCTKFTDKDLKADKIIISGTSLKDKDYLENLGLFKWIDFYNKPILGICAGMQILSNHFKGELIEEKEIGLNRIKINKDFLGIKKDNLEVYSLHNFSVKPNEDFFKVFGNSNKVIQAIKHKTKPFYGILFHPEVRNKALIEGFVGL
jgi:GMP synthase (glutamine-hydrolysing)